MIVIQARMEPGTDSRTSLRIINGDVRLIMEGWMMDCLRSGLRRVPAAALLLLL